ncbi:MAG: M10 family metallopeptidase C-terminal domain-containing protein, partial [Pseudomonadota bacterium]
MGAPSAQEVLQVEFINRARSDPRGELDKLILSTNPLVTVDPTLTRAMEFFGTDLALLFSQLDGIEAVAPVAWNSDLNDSATTHSQLMIDFDEQEHNLPGEPLLGERVEIAGYDFNRVAENIFAFGESPEHIHGGFYVDFGGTNTGIQDPPGHRNAILNPAFYEIGVGILTENDSSTNVGPFVVTQHFGSILGTPRALTGVIIDDQDNDDFYDIGEGIGGVTITATGINGTPGTFQTQSFGAGLYTLSLPDGTYSVTYSGSGLDQSVTETVTIDGLNVKLDVEKNGEVRAVIVGDRGAQGIQGEFFNPVTTVNDILEGTSGDDILRGKAGNDTLIGGAGADTIDGGDGLDTVSFAGSTSRNQVDILTPRAGLNDSAGDVYISIENMIGGDSFDLLLGTREDNTISGGGARDRLFGRGGDDTIDGGAGDDQLYGLTHTDVLTGGEGADEFIYFLTSDSRAGEGKRDIITDFTRREDVIELRRLDADETQGGRQQFTWIDREEFSGTAGELRYDKQGARDRTLIQADLDGDGVRDFEIEL